MESTLPSTSEANKTDDLKSKTLICIPSPRDIPLVKESIDSIKGTPKLWVKYHNETEAYAVIEKYFLEMSDAEYMCLIPDDLIVQQRNIDALLHTIHTNGPDKTPVLSGVCNLHNIPGQGTILCVCIDSLIHPQRRRRNWIWLDMRSAEWQNDYSKRKLMEVKFSGFACQFIRRDIVQEIGLHGDLRYNEWHRQAQDYSFDVIFCWLCNQHKPEPIPIYINPQVRMLHLRGSDSRQVQGIEPLLVGKPGYDKKVIHVSADGKEEDVTTLVTPMLSTTTPTHGPPPESEMR